MLNRLSEVVAQGVAPGQLADQRSRRLLSLARVVAVRVQDGILRADVEAPMFWTSPDGRPQYATIRDVIVNVPVAIGEGVLLETIGDGGPTTFYLGGRAGQPRPLHVSGRVSGAPYRIALAAGGPSSSLNPAFQWYRKLGAFRVRGESSAFAASATFEGLGQATPAMTSKLPATAPVTVAPRTGIGTADLSQLNSELEGGTIFNNSVPFAVRLAALGPYDADGNPVRPTDPGAAWIHGEAGAGERGGTVAPGHITVADNQDVAVSFDAAFDMGREGAGLKYDLYLIIAADGGTAPIFTAERIRLNVLEAAWNTNYRRTELDDDGH